MGLHSQFCANTQQQLMPNTYSIHPERNLIRQTLWGRITVDELRDIITSLRKEPHYRAQMDVLADLRNAEIDISYDQMTDYTRFLAGSNSTAGRQAIVVSRQLEFGLARMYEQLTENTVLRTDLRVFMDMEEAELWIGNGRARNLFP